MSKGDFAALGAEIASRTLERMIRVNHAGELGAVRIYEGQTAILGRGRQGSRLRSMLAQEKVHYAYFQQEIARRQIRPTILEPVWIVAGWALGAGTALLGDKAAMACTAAVEEVIDAHYARQLDVLEQNGKDEQAALKQAIARFRADEREHRDIALAQKAEKAFAYPFLRAAIGKGTRLAIWLSERF